jgi:large subunit ribosomal protein L18
MLAQVVDDSVGRDPGVGVDDGGGPPRCLRDKTAKARKVGELVAERAKKAGIEAVVFDRGGNKYHGRWLPSLMAPARVAWILTA